MRQMTSLGSQKGAECSGVLCGWNFLRVGLALALVCAFAGSAFALDYGQVKGLITDKKSKEPLIGASVSIVGTDMGAITDVNGKYVIRLVPPNTYELKISMLGYAEVTVTDVRVFSELTFEQNVKMVDETTELEGVKIFADAPMIDKFEVSSTTKLQKEQIQRKPVTTIDDLLKTVSGIVISNDGNIHIRGGRAGEIAFIVDGVNVRDPVGGPGPVQGGVSLVAGSVQEIQVIKDGFDPEFGNALSGVIKITSQTGPPDRTALNLRFITDDFGNASLNKFSRNYDNFRFTLAGPDPFLTSKILPALGLDFLKDKELTYFFFAEVEKHNGSFNPLDYVTGASNRSFDGASILGINVPERLYNSYNLNTNISFKPRNNLKFILSYQKTFSRDPVFTLGSGSWIFRDTPGTLTQNERDWQLASLKMTHSLSKDFNYEVILSYKRNEVNFGPGDPDHPGKIVQPDQFLLQDFWESYTDVNNDGVYTAPEPLVNSIPDTLSYGVGLGGPAYTFGEFNSFVDVQSGVSWGNPALNALLGTGRIRDFQFNLNGQVVGGFVPTDALEGEFFADLNGNGIWDQGDPFRDTNGNGQYDPSRSDRFGEDNPEPFRDGDISLGEPFTDVNGNRVYDPGIDVFLITTGPQNQDLNRNSIYDGPNPESWTERIPFVDLNGNGVFDPPNGVYDAGELFVDKNNNGKYDGRDEFLDANNYDVNAQWHRHVINTLGGELKLNRTMGNHDFKAGFEIHRDDFSFQDIRRPYQPFTGRPDGGAFPERGSSRDFFDYQPVQGAVYFRDKLEYGSMIASLGFRWDFFVQSDGLLEIALNDDLNTGIILGDRSKFSPRIGFSYPISDKAKVFFNYGHFYQLPTYDLLYGRNTSSAEISDVVGNYNLDFMKTIQYSFGVRYALSNVYALTVGGYYKDEFDKVAQGDVRLGAIRVRQYQNRDYGRGRGFEMTLEKRRGLVNGEVSYVYAFAFGKASQTNRDFLTDFAISRESLAETALDFDVRHQAKVAVQLVVPKNQDASLFGIPIPNNWTLSLEGLFETGRPFTPGRDFPDLELPPGQQIESNSLRQPGRLFFDARLEKNFILAGINYSGILWVENVFDNRFSRSVFSSTGLPNTSQNLGSGVLGGSVFDQNPLRFAAGREIRVGIQMSL